MSNSISTVHCTLFIIFICTVAFTSCDNTLNPLEEDEVFFSIYGTLDMTEEVNYFRINDLNSTVLDTSDHQLDAHVTLENLQSGEREVLEDTVVSFEDTYVTNFKSEMEIHPRTEYEITVERSDGATTRSSAITPDTTVMDLQHDQQHKQEAPDCTTNVELTLEPIEDPLTVRFYLGVEHLDKIRWFLPHFHTLSVDGQLTYTFTPESMLAGITDDVVPDQCHELETDEFHIRYVRFGPDWHSERHDSLAIKNGYGRFGGSYEERIAHPLDTTDVYDDIIFFSPS